MQWEPHRATYWVDHHQSDVWFAVNILAEFDIFAGIPVECLLVAFPIVNSFFAIMVIVKMTGWAFVIRGSDYAAWIVRGRGLELYFEFGVI